MKYLLVASAAIMLSACGNNFDTKQVYDPRSISGIDPAFKPYVDVFESKYGSSIGDIPIQFADLTYPTIGTCTRWSSGHRQIVVDKDYWDNPDVQDSAKLGLILHELGHCVLNRDHVNSLYYYAGTHVAGHIPYSIMYPYNFYSNNYLELESYYLEELFHPTDKYSTQTKLSSKNGCVHDIDGGIIPEIKP